MGRRFGFLAILGILLGGVLSLCVTAHAAMLANETITVGATAIGISSSTMTARRTCFGRLSVAQIRFWTDGTNPTAATGIILEVGDTLELGVAQARGLRMIRTGATSGVFSVVCY